MKKKRIQSTEPLPESIVIFGHRMTQQGRGNYPYACIAKDERPHAMIYSGPINPEDPTGWGVWESEDSFQFLNRDRSFDTYSTQTIPLVK